MRFKPLTYSTASHLGTGAADAVGFIGKAIFAERYGVGVESVGFNYVGSSIEI